MVKNYYITDEDFTSFLEGVGGLENGYFTDRPRIKDVGFFCIGPGWYGLVKELIEGAIAAGWDRQICQVKEKFGGLRFYINGAPEEVWALIREAEEKSYEVCEVCGEPGELKQTGWYSTLCDEHNTERNNK